MSGHPHPASPPKRGEQKSGTLQRLHRRRPGGCGLRRACRQARGTRGVVAVGFGGCAAGALGVNVEADRARIEKSLRECHIGFLFAPNFHPALRHVAPVRRELGMRTIFNLLGPICNPANPKRQLVGVYDASLTETLASALRELGSERAWVVHGAGGLDELSLCGPSQVTELKDGTLRTFTVTPEDAGLTTGPQEAIRGSAPDDNAQALMNLLMGAKNAYRDIVLLNASAALIVAGKAADLKEGAEMAAQAIDSGRAKETLARLVWITNEELEVEGSGKIR